MKQIDIEFQEFRRMQEQYEKEKNHIANLLIGLDRAAGGYTDSEGYTYSVYWIGGEMMISIQNPAEDADDSTNILPQ